MTKAEWDRVKTLFHEVLRVAAEERSAFLDERCKGDVHLRGQVDGLIAAHEDAGGFLGSPARLAGEETPGTIIGRYKLQEKIGEGGFGDVWMAEQQEPIQRQVALKIIKLGMDTRHVIARFEAERQALALMEHPNIATVLDAGATEVGRPFFVMELVRGVPITEYCDTNRLPTADRLDLFHDVCRAAEHAHEKGVIHRDLKPTNVLVTQIDGRAVPKIIDFGIAKATERRLTEKTLFTAFRQFVGTPMYMSPEQAEMSGAEIDVRTDVWSLGILLYELLTGTTPFEDRTLDEIAWSEIQRVIREVEPPPPSTRVSTLGERTSEIVDRRRVGAQPLMRRLKGELDWIVMKALEKDRTRRYDSAGDLADDVRRHLDDRPISAGRPSRIRDVRKALARHRVAVSALVAVGIALFLGVTAAATMAARAREAEMVARHHAERAQAVLEFQTEMFNSVDPQAGRDVGIRDILDSSLERLENLDEPPLVESRLRRTVAATYLELGNADLARKHAEQAIERADAELGTDHVESLLSRLLLAKVYQEAGAIDEAIALSEHVVDRLAERLGPTHAHVDAARATLAELYEAVGRTEEADELRGQLGGE